MLEEREGDGYMEMEREREDGKRERDGKEINKGTMERVDVDVTSRYTGRIHTLEMAWVVG